MHIFTYGSLMFPEVWQRVVHGDCRSGAATLNGYRRRAMHGVTYPGVVPDSAESVAGLLYFDVAPHHVQALDCFEGAEYERREVSVTLSNGTVVQAHTYIYLHPEKLSDSPWQPERFDVARFLRLEA